MPLKVTRPVPMMSTPRPAVLWEMAPLTSRRPAAPPEFTLMLRSEFSKMGAAITSVETVPLLDCTLLISARP